MQSQGEEPVPSPTAVWWQRQVEPGEPQGSSLSFRQFGTLKRHSANGTVCGNIYLMGLTGTAVGSAHLSSAAAGWDTSRRNIWS